MIAVPCHLSWKRSASSTSPPPVRTGHLSPTGRLGNPQPRYHRNQQYSIVALTNAAGTLVERYTYSVYGTLGIYDPAGTVRSSSTYGNRYTYTGREWDLELNLYHFRARWYDPATGGFISRDPLGYVDGMSLYRGYFGVHGVDPSGTLLRSISEALSDEDEVDALVPDSAPNGDTFACMAGAALWRYDRIVIDNELALSGFQSVIMDSFHRNQFVTPSCTDDDNCRSFAPGYQSRHVRMSHQFTRVINFGNPKKPLNGVFDDWFNNRRPAWMLGNATVTCSGETSLGLNCKTCEYSGSTCLTCSIHDRFDLRPNSDRGFVYNTCGTIYTGIFVFGLGFSEPTVSVKDNWKFCWHHKSYRHRDDPILGKKPSNYIERD